MHKHWRAAPCSNQEVDALNLRALTQWHVSEAGDSPKKTTVEISASSKS